MSADDTIEVGGQARQEHVFSTVSAQRGEVETFDLKPNFVSLGLPSSAFKPEFRGSASAKTFDASIGGGTTIPGVVWFFMGEEYVPYDVTKQELTGPATIAANWGSTHWPPMFASGVDAVIRKSPPHTALTRPPTTRSTIRTTPHPPCRDRRSDRQIWRRCASRQSRPRERGWPMPGGVRGLAAFLWRTGLACGARRAWEVDVHLHRRGRRRGLLVGQRFRSIWLCSAGPTAARRWGASKDACTVTGFGTTNPSP